MSDIIYFMLGSIFTAGVFMAGAIIGYLLVNKKIREENNTTAPLTPKVNGQDFPRGSGAVKAINPEEIAKERQKDFIDKMGELIGNES